MDAYQLKIIEELTVWEKEMLKYPSYTDLMAKDLQSKVIQMIPDKIHEVITTAIKLMIETVLIGSDFIDFQPPQDDLTMAQRDVLAEEKLNTYKNLVTISGFGTGAGGIILGLADFPLFLSMKMKFLHEIASVYGKDIRNYEERLFILMIFQLTFSSKQRRRAIYPLIKNWEKTGGIKEMDWRIFQQEYRDAIDLAKMLQIVPGIGAIAGATANHILMKQLGEIAQNCYHLRAIETLKNQ